VARVRPRVRQIVSLLAILALVCGGVELPAPRVAVAQAYAPGRVIYLHGIVHLHGIVNFGHPTQTVVVFLTSGTSYTVPSSWNSNANTIEVIGGGAGGASACNSCATGGTAIAGGGGGGSSYSAISNLSLTPGNSVTYQVGTGGGAGVAGGDTYFQWVG
jgi:hypothetical protein